MSLKSLTNLTCVATSPGPGEKLTLIRVITMTNEVADYGQEFGLKNHSFFGTEGSIYDGHYYWGLNLNWLCSNPRGTLTLVGSCRITTYSFKLVREGPKGRTSTPLPIDLDHARAADVPPAVIAKWAEIGKTAVGEGPVQDTVPGFGKKA
ncbi:hypothetical protein DFH09DRAFT_1482225 [Mycena vulgaris]|nr:hypothetical protein DFH09DRAFT_1482225 [Mycena vulgaris]